MMRSPETLIAWAASGLGAGPPTTDPSLMLNWLPWHGQSIVPLLIWLTMHPMCVQTALNALKSPETGCVTTTFSAVKILPLPTGISLVGARAFAPLPAAAGVEAPGALGAPALVPALAPPLVPPGELLEPLDVQALMAPARPTRPTPASTPRRVARVSRCGSCVTSAPVQSRCVPDGRADSGYSPWSPSWIRERSRSWRGSRLP